MNKFFEKMKSTIFQHEIISPLEKENCDHDYIIQDSYFEVCKKCGECNDKIFYITQNENQIGYKEERIRFKTAKYSKLKDIRQKLIDFNIRQQHATCDRNEFDKVMEHIKQNLPMKIIKQGLKETNSPLSYEDFFFGLKSPVRHELKRKEIDEIILTCEKFIKTCKDIKNINKKALVYVIAEDKYNYILSNWICSTNKKIIQKYRNKLQELKLSVKAVAASSHVL